MVVSTNMNVRMLKRYNSRCTRCLHRLQLVSFDLCVAANEGDSEMESSDYTERKSQTGEMIKVALTDDKQNADYNYTLNLGLLSWWVRFQVKYF